jgi:hypothetical protein
LTLLSTECAPPFYLLSFSSGRINRLQRANKAEFDKLVESARMKPSRESPELPPGSATLAKSSAVRESGLPEPDPRLKRQTVASGGETDAIVVDSDPDS